MCLFDKRAILSILLLLSLLSQPLTGLAQGNPTLWRALYDSAYQVRNYEPRLTLQIATRITQEARNANNEEWVLRGNALKGLGYLIISKMDSAELLLAPMLTNPNISEWPDLHSQVLFQMGFIAQRQSKLSRAIELLNHSLVISTQLGDSALVAKACGTIRSVYLELQLNQKALLFAKRSLNAYRSQNDSLGMARSLSDVADLYLDIKDTVLALNYYDSAIVLYEAIDYSSGLAIVYNNRSYIYQAQNNMSKLKEELFKAIELNTAAQNLNFLAVNYFLMHEYYISQGDLDSAYYFCEKAYLTGGEYLTSDQLELLMYKFSQMLKSRGNYQRAMELLDSAYKLRISIFSTEQVTEIGRLQQQYDYEAQQQAAAALAAAEAEAERQRINFQFLLIFGIVGLAILGIVLTGKLRMGIRATGTLTLFVVLLFFEAILVFIDPILDDYISGLPLPKLGANLALAILFTLGHEAMNRRLARRAKHA